MIKVRKTETSFPRKFLNEFKNNSIMDYLKENIRTELFEVLLKVIHTPNIFLKVYLFIFVLISSSLAAYTVVESLLNYFDHQVITTSRTIYETPTLFPKVTFCNTNMFTSEYGFELFKNASKQVSPNLNILNDTETFNLKTDEKIDIFLKIFLIMSGIVNNKYYSDENKKRIAHNLEDILIDCKFNYQKCSASDFVWHFDPLFGNCYVFNSGYNSTGDPIECCRSSRVLQAYFLVYK